MSQFITNSNHFNETNNLNSQLLSDLNDEKRTFMNQDEENFIQSQKNKLDLSKQQIYSLEERLSKEIQIKFSNDFNMVSILNLNDNLLGEVPESIRLLTQLEQLSLRGNHILEIPKWLPTDFKLLRKLDLSHNVISQVPVTFNKFSTLEDLNLSNNYISHIPPSFFPENIMTLDLSHNLFKEIELPPWFESLLSLDISGNKLKHLGNLPYHLVKVSIDDNHLESIDHKVIIRNKDLALKFNQSFSDIVLERIYQCWYTGDPVLDLSGLGMCVVPPILGELTHLTHLDLSGNCISVLPPELSKLTELVRLDISYNILTTLPLYIVSFKKLESLELQGTLDYLVSPPRRIAETGKLIDIQRYFQDLFQGDPSYRVKLMIVGQENVGKTSLVKCLKMKKKFAKGVDHLGTNVSTDGIDIEEIKFNLDVEVPSQSVPSMPSSNSTSSLSSHPPQIQPTLSSASLNSSFSIGSNINSNNNNNNNNNSNVHSSHSNGTHSNSSSGNPNNSYVNTNSNGGNVNSNGNTLSNGGTSNVNSNGAPSAMNTSITSSTGSGLGPVGSMVNQKVTMSIWDCAGQELYYTSHQMFLTDSALYVVVWNLCKPEVNSRVEFWLHSIRSKAESAPILLIGTHLDDYLQTHNESELDDILSNIYNKYFRKFKLKGICVVSCSTGHGFDQFLDLLKKTVVDLPSLKQSLPELYLKLEKLIIKKRTTMAPPILTWQNYSQMVLSNLDFHDEVHVKVATKSLVPLGSISFFDEPGLDQYVFLDPQWLTGVFSSIITTKHKFIKDGVLRKSDLYQIWKPPHFIEDENLHSLLISLLERFELMFPLDNIDSSTPSLNASQVGNSYSTGSQNGGSNKSSPFKPPTSPQTLRLGSDKRNSGSSSATILQSAASSNNKKRNQTITGSPSGRSRSNSDIENSMLPAMSPNSLSQSGGINADGSNTSGDINQIGSPSKMGSNTLTTNIFNEFNQRFIIPSQLPDTRPAFGLLWPSTDNSRIEYNRWIQLSFAPAGLFSRLLIRLLTSKEFEMKPILYWRNGVVVDAQSGRGFLATSTALIEMCPSYSNCSSTIKISVRGDRRSGKSLAAKLLRLIVEITDTLCTSWYHLETNQVIPCPHCSNKSNCTLFSLTECESVASSGVWYLVCGDRKIGFESFVPDVAMSDFWGSGSKKFNYNEIKIHKEKQILMIKSNVYGEIQFDIKLPIINGADNNNNNGENSQPTSPRKENDLPFINQLVSLESTASSKEIIPIKIEFDSNNQTLIVSGSYKKQIGNNKQDQFIIGEVEFDSPKLIGRGASGKIYRANLGDTMVAVKQLEVVGEDAPRIFSDFRREIHVMSDLKHPNVVNLLGFTLNPFTMVMEYIDCGDLHKFLHSQIGDILNGNWALILKLALDIAKGMDFLHSVTPPLLHRDLKSPNVLLSMKNGVYHAKVGDFGLSSRMFIQALKHKLRNFPVGNITWVAPEILREEEYTVKSDVYAFGLILHELMTRKHPYREFNYQMVSLQEEAIKSGLRPTIAPQYTQTVTGHEYCALIRDCWDSDIDRRPTFNKIVKRIKQIIGRDVNNILEGTDIGSSPSIDPVSQSKNLDDSNNPHISHMNLGDAPSDENLGGQLQLSMRTQPEAKVNQLVWELGSRRVWGGCEGGEILVWNAENGNQIFREQKLHPGPIRAMALVNQEDIWSTGATGSHCSIRVWNAWRFNLDDQQGTKSDYITKKGRGGSTFGRKSWRVRWFVLSRFDKSLKYYAKQNDKDPNCTLLLEGAWLEEQNAGFRVSLHLSIPEKRTMELEFKTESEKSSWMIAINRVINQNIPLHEITLGKFVKSENDYVTSILVINQNVWVGFKESNHIVVFNSKTKDLVQKIQMDDQWKGTDQMILHQSFVWVAGRNNLAQIDSSSYQILHVHNHYTQPILSMASVENNVWVSAEDTSLSIWDGENGSFIKKVENTTNSKFTKILFFSGYLWACSQGSIQIYCIHNHVSKKKVETKNHPNSIIDLIKVFQQTVWSCCGSHNICIFS
ncbi:roco6, ROCO family protein [Dictyostelium purpureum]|uniref:non-specific serine/threonine protein kinase n=1 Tax=Dictyostelium purpureum TaxID=5786 RepID=F0ZZA9_DICPU|nr:roco6, ROCO family protein [Dictyostelium purpureum]EGC30717.1 roco6, ROCO family protein [Dictyostelium purpureum]|eukprot:XP_003292752.1 roco6, ROCO family protein [Dictyostelium purpureum]